MKAVQKNSVNSVEAKSSAKVGLNFTKEDLERMHWLEGMPMTRIAREYSVSPAAIGYWFKKWKVKNRANVRELLWVPSPAMSYVFGVLHGDAFLATRGRAKRFDIVLRVTDPPFAASFKAALQCIGLSSNTIVQPPSGIGIQEVYITYSSSKLFHQKWNAMSKTQRLDFGLAFPRDFVRGVYDSEGTIKRRRRGGLELSMCSTNIQMLKCVRDALCELSLHPKFHFRKTDYGTDIAILSLWRNLEVRRFLCLCSPSIKTVPRHANTEPSRGGDTLEGVESTKAIPRGKQVGPRSAMNGCAALSTDLNSVKMCSDLAGNRKNTAEMPVSKT